MSWLGEKVLGRLVRMWPSPQAARDQRLGAEPGSEAYDQAYTREQFMNGVWFGSPLERDFPSLFGARVLEIGCGHGGITCFLATQGSRIAVGIDLAIHHMRHGRELARSMGQQRSVQFVGMDASRLAFKSQSFDVVIANNLFEHVTEPMKVLGESFRILVPGGVLVVPVFSSIHSKWGTHLKHGLKMPWANLMFSDRTIINVLKDEARRKPYLLDVYPGLAGSPQELRDVRRFKDLNDITYAEFRAQAKEAGFVEKAFRIHATTAGRLVTKLAPAARATPVLDVLSTGAGAVLQRPEAR